MNSLKSFMMASLFLSKSIDCVLNDCPQDIFDQQYPQFQIIAAAKTGSTSLYSYLCQHPSIECLAKKKETNILRNERMIPRTEKVCLFSSTANLKTRFKGENESFESVLT